MNALKKMNWIELNWVELSRVDLNHWVNQWMNECMHACMNAWMNAWMDGWMNEWVNEWRNEWMNERVSQWNQWLSEWMLYLQRVLWRSQFFTFSMWNRALATVLCTFYQQLLQIEARTSRNRDPTSATTEATLPEKKHRISCPRVFSSLKSRVPDLLHFPNTWWWWWWCGWQDDVVDMMVRMLPMTIVRNSEVF